MPPSLPSSNNRKSSNTNTIKGCDPCKRRKRVCNGQKPCNHCSDTLQECVYSAISDHTRSVFSTNTARRLSSGSACETCRRRKTKCDGLSPCSFCANNGIECVNNSERRKRSLVPSNLSTTTTAASTSTANTSIASTNVNENETMDRIEDRLRRIERLMTAFTPISQPPNSNQHKTAFRKLSSPHLQKSTNDVTRQQRHSMYNISNNNSSNNNTPSPPLSPRLLLQQSSSSSTTSMVANSMLNLSLSPSSSSTSSSSYIPSTTTNENQWNSLKITSSLQKEWKQSTPIPSLMDQLSKCTFVTTAMEYNTVQYPIYPILPPTTSSNTNDNNNNNINNNDNTTNNTK